MFSWLHHFLLCGCCRTGDEERQWQLHPGQPFKSQGGLFAEEAIKVLQEFYIAGNPAGGWGGAAGVGRLA